MSKFGTIVLIPFPFTDLSSSKVRPALVISKHNTSEDVIVCFITSRSRATSWEINPGDNNYENSGLKVTSYVCFDKIATLHRRLLLGELGTIDPEILQERKEEFLSHFGWV